MAKKTGRARVKKSDNTVAVADKSALVDPDNLQELAVERKDQYLERIKKEEAEEAKAFVVEEEWLEITGKKVLKRHRNKAGSVYSQYWFNLKKHKAEARMLRDKGYLNYGDPDGEEELRQIPLKFIDGKPFALKKK